MVTTHRHLHRWARTPHGNCGAYISDGSRTISISKVLYQVVKVDKAECHSC